jgi:cyclic beta-1,2-glucan synthetase
MLGVTKRGDILTIAPCVPSGWPGYRVDYRVGAALYEIDVQLRPADSTRTDTTVMIDGRLRQDATIPLRDDGAVHHVVVLAPASPPSKAMS